MRKLLLSILASVLAHGLPLPTATPALADPPPVTNLSISASASQVSPSDTIILTISETNTGDPGAPALATPYVELDDGLTIEILDKNSASYVDGDLDGDNGLDTDETWTWQVERTVIADTTYVATGHGIWTCTDRDVTDRDSVTVQVVEECAECDGKVTQLTLSYNGSVVDALIRVEQKGKNGGVVFEDIVQPGAEFTFSGIDKNGTLGTEISIYIGGTLNTKIHTSCSQPIGIGMVFGDFEIVAGESLKGGAFCSP